MSRDPPSIASLKAYSRERGDVSEGAAIVRELRGQNDRAIAILMASHIEDDLVSCIRKHLRDDLTATDENLLFSGDAPLARFSSRIRFAYALSIIGPRTRDDLDLIRVLRNTAAHTRRPFSFDIPTIQRPLERLNILKTENLPVPEGGDTPRARFTQASIMLSMRLIRYAGDSLSRWEKLRLLS